MTKSLLAATTLTLLLISCVAKAADTQKMITTNGLGSASCGTWTKIRRDRVRDQARGYEQWVLGYLSAAAIFGSERDYDPLHNVDAEGVFAWIDNYCRENPLQTVVWSAGEFVLAHPR